MNEFFQKISKIKYRNIVWILAITETIHNMEEAILLPNLFQSGDFSKWPVSPFEFRFAVILITLLIYGMIYYFVKHENKLAEYLMGGTLFTILFNVFIPHLIGSVLLLKYLPGTASGVLLNIPVTLYLLRRGVREGFFTIKSIAVWGGIFTIITVPFLFGLFKFGNFISNAF
jgi:hypothetical protein